ncbi:MULTISPECIES: hypothetical protein [Micromonospora]|uniref:Uncharacterized protein n=1 Tax=Micromonospora yangpuensis TaxID=683228 RepID=A0A1C6VEZ4_9ACTN|nr:hypothetical protein [Micromonospora yangpuensis]GGM30106.1 hypothetical protein GCM10012279_56240 [Micromonospora yangpuensis]SCL64898.1 hypothetical protein GA0070617_5597 [Micromonospora yangpuensis]
MAVTNGTGTARGHGTAAGPGTFAALLLVAVCGSPAYADWAEANTDPSGAGGWFMRLLAWPSWQFGFDEVPGMAPGDLRAILVVVLAALFLYLLPAAQTARAPGGLSQFFSGWAAYVLAGAFAALLGSLLGTDASLMTAFQAVGTGATYGVFAGWIVGAASLGGRA